MFHPLPSVSNLSAQSSGFPGTLSPPHHQVLPHLTSPHLNSHHLASPNLTLPHLTSPHLTSPPHLTLPHHLTSPHLTSSPHFTSPHLTSPHLISPHHLTTSPSTWAGGGEQAGAGVAGVPGNQHKLTNVGTNQNNHGKLGVKNERFSIVSNLIT